MRRLLSILLVAVLGLPLVSPLLAQGAALESALPVCCRRGGVHHCMGAMGQAPAPGETMVAAVQAKCPRCPAAMVATHAGGGMLVGGAAGEFAVSAAGRVRAGRARSGSSVLRGEACPKRGPPGLSLL